MPLMNRKQKVLSKLKWYWLKNGSINLFYWFRTIWADRPYDHTHFYQILHIKLSDMENFYRSDYPISSNPSKTAEEIKVAKEAAKRLADDKYYPIKTKDMSYYEAFTSNIQEDITADQMREEDKKKLFNTIRDNIDKWWD